MKSTDYRSCYQAVAHGISQEEAKVLTFFVPKIRLRAPWGLHGNRRKETLPQLWRLKNPQTLPCKHLRLSVSNELPQSNEVVVHKVGDGWGFRV